MSGQPVSSSALTTLARPHRRRSYILKPVEADAPIPSSSPSPASVPPIEPRVSLQPLPRFSDYVSSPGVGTDSPGNAPSAGIAQSGRGQVQLPSWPSMATPPSKRNLADTFSTGGSSSSAAETGAVRTPPLTVWPPPHPPRGAAAELAAVFASPRALAFKECAEQDVALCLKLPPGAKRYY